MLFHIRQTRDHAKCGSSIEAIYYSLDEHITTEASVENRQAWFPNDAICYACVRKARMRNPSKLLACTDIKAGTWVVLCACGGVRPQDAKCGKAATLPLDRPPMWTRGRPEGGLE